MTKTFKQKITHLRVDDDGIHEMPDISIDDARARMMASIMRGGKSGISRSLQKIEPKKRKP